MRLAFVTGLEGLKLQDAEARFLKDSEPAGIILFKRNVRDREQLKRLIGEARDCIGANDALIMVDQEGGRVQRLSQPEWRAYPPACSFGLMFEKDPEAAREALALVSRLIASDLHEIGFNTNCVPCIDVPVEGAHDIIGTRAFARDVDTVVALGRVQAMALRDGGVLPVVKHVPGHGRAGVDSHEDLPVVDAEFAELAESDFATFRALADMPAMMTAHVVFSAIEEGVPASTSARVHERVIRGEIGFDGLLISDDLSMSALEGKVGARARAVIQAGSDIALHCNGNLAEMEMVAATVPGIADKAAERFAAACSVIAGPAEFDEADALEALEAVSRIACA